MKNVNLKMDNFENEMNRSIKKERSQYYTPQNVIEMCVKMLNPKKGEYMIDTASGHCGFLVHSQEKGAEVFGIDIDKNSTDFGRDLNLKNILSLNTIDYLNWEEMVNDPEWFKIYGEAYNRLLKLSRNGIKEFNFDLMLGNPPYGTIKAGNFADIYTLAHKRKNVKLEELFIERNLDFLKPGGRLAMVLPRGVFNNVNQKSIRDYMSSKARILAVVGLEENTFKPHTGTNTSVIFLQKWDDKLCPKVGDYPIFFAVSEKSGKSDNGKKFIYKENGELDHDLDDIAENYIDFAKTIKLSFIDRKKNIKKT